MTHEGLGVALGVLLEALLGVLLEGTRSRREEATGCNAGSHCVGLCRDGGGVVVCGAEDGPGTGIEASSPNAVLV